MLVTLITYVQVSLATVIEVQSSLISSGIILSYKSTSTTYNIMVTAVFISCFNTEAYTLASAVDDNTAYQASPLRADI